MLLGVFFLILGHLFRKARVVLRAGGAGIAARWVPGSPGWRRGKIKAGRRAAAERVWHHPAWAPSLPAAGPASLQEKGFCILLLRQGSGKASFPMEIISQLFYLLFRKCDMGIGTGAASR